VKYGDTAYDMNDNNNNDNLVPTSYLPACVQEPATCFLI
jgi:hypothetical protein